MQEGTLHWGLIVVLVQEVFQSGQVPMSFQKSALVLVPKTDPMRFQCVALLETIYKLCSSVINHHMNKNIGWRKGMHGFQMGHSYTTAIIKAKLVAEQAKCEGKVRFQIFWT